MLDIIDKERKLLDKGETTDQDEFTDSDEYSENEGLKYQAQVTEYRSRVRKAIHLVCATRLGFEDDLDTDSDSDSTESSDTDTDSESDIESENRGYIPSDCIPALRNENFLTELFEDGAIETPRSSKGGSSFEISIGEPKHIATSLKNLHYQLAALKERTYFPSKLEINEKLSTAESIRQDYLLKKILPKIPTMQSTAEIADSLGVGDTYMKFSSVKETTKLPKLNSVNSFEKMIFPHAEIQAPTTVMMPDEKLLSNGDTSAKEKLFYNKANQAEIENDIINQSAVAITSETQPFTTIAERSLPDARACAPPVALIKACMHHQESESSSSEEKSASMKFDEMLGQVVSEPESPPPSAETSPSSRQSLKARDRKSVV